MGIFTLDFMMRALIAAALTGLMAPAAGTYIVQRQLSLLGDGLGHVAIAGVGLALLTGNQPIPVAVAVCIAGAVAIELLRQSGRTSGDVGLAILFYGGLASGVLMAGLAGNGAGSLSQYLFGSLTSISDEDVMVVAVMAVIVLVATLGLAPQLFAVCVDEDYAHTQGLRTRWLNLLVVIIAAITVAVSMRTVGLMLVSALMVIPVATANNISHGFIRTLMVAMGLGLVTSVGGVVGSYYLDSASGATIVVLGIIVFIVSLPLRSIVQRRHRQAITAEEESGLFKRVSDHELTQAEAQALAMLHGDHVDYVHNGRRYAPHGDHCDDHSPEAP